MTLETETVFLAQTPAWQRRFRELGDFSPKEEWNWIVGHFQGDQDDLDHLINKYKSPFPCNECTVKIPCFCRSVEECEKKRGIEKE
jgi:hypothetical protein